MTAQIPDILHHRGMTLDLCDQALQPYLDRLRKDRRPRFYQTTTACHRGYVATWEIRDGMLTLTALEAAVEAGGRFVWIGLAEAFPWAGDSLPATWFTGEVRCPEGRMRDYVHHAFASVYERDRLMYFDKGRLVCEHLVLNPPQPLIYRIDPDGTRTCMTGFGHFAEELPDPLAGHDLRDAHLHWGRPLPDDAEDGYAVGGYLTLPPEAPGPGGAGAGGAGAGGAGTGGAGAEDV